MSDYIPTRLSHLMWHCSVGSIVRGPEYLMTVKDIREWTDRSGKVASRLIPYVDQVRAALGIDQELRTPPIAKELDNGQVDGVCIPALRFPSWMRCPKCGMLSYQPWRGLAEGNKPRCKECDNHPILEQVTCVLIHKLGYLADVPWHWLAHRNAAKQDQKQCRADSGKLYLRFTEEKKVHKRQIHCKKCGAFFGDFSDGLRIPFINSCQQPWIRCAPRGASQPIVENDHTEPALVLEVNDARVHLPVGSTALVIPPESRIRKGTVIDRLYRSSQKRQRIDQSRNDLARKGILRSLALEFRCSLPEIEEALKDIQTGYPLYGATMTRGLLFESEYRALIDELSDVFDDEDFVARHHTNVWKSLENDLSQGSRVHVIIQSITRVIAVTRLKEIRVFKGFKRGGFDDSYLVPPDIVGQSDWLPAIELYGEGIFFTLDEKALQGWEKHPKLIRRAAISKARYKQANVPAKCDAELDIHVTPRFLLMHTLAHILIRQLESEAGYPAASLKERIYCRDGKDPMAGILIYVAVPDIAGSMGGLVELSEPKRFLTLLSGVFDLAEWCSLDPICSEHEGQGPQMLNRAACHACSLIPEPSCAYGNVLLDRVFITGDITEGIPSFLDYIATSAGYHNGQTEI